MGYRMRKKFNFKQQKGFTLVEMLVVIAIIAILSVFFIPNFREGEAQMRLQRSANKLYQDFRRVQEMAISSRVCAECPLNPDSAPLRGYGLAMSARDFDTPELDDNKKYIIYANNNPDSSEYYYDSSAGDIVIETVYFEKGVYVKDVVDLEEGLSYDHFGVNFRPPEPNMGMQCDVCYHKISRVAEVILAIEGYPEKTKTIYVNIAGLIYESD
jgi:prepilin-type N-terminal cleavage/methylation domain-containing protein